MADCLLHRKHHDLGPECWAHLVAWMRAHSIGTSISFLYHKYEAAYEKACLEDIRRWIADETTVIRDKVDAGNYMLDVLNRK